MLMTVICIYCVNCMKFGQLILKELCIKFGQLILKEVIQIVTTRCYILRLKMHQI